MNTAIIAIILFGLCIVELAAIIKLSATKTIGSIRINTSDPDKDVYSLELDVPFGELDRQNQVIFKIIHD